MASPGAARTAGSPARMRRARLVLPQPLGPSSRVREPVGRAKRASRSKVRPPTVNVRPRTSRAVRLTRGEKAPSSISTWGSGAGLSGSLSMDRRVDKALPAWLIRFWLWVLSRLCRRASLLPIRLGALRTWLAFSRWH